MKRSTETDVRYQKKEQVDSKEFSLSVRHRKSCWRHISCACVADPLMADIIFLCCGCFSSASVTGTSLPWKLNTARKQSSLTLDQSSDAERNPWKCIHGFNVTCWENSRKFMKLLKAEHHCKNRALKNRWYFWVREKKISIQCTHRLNKNKKKIYFFIKLNSLYISL